MTSKDRLLRVLDGRLPDRVPISTYELVGYDGENFCNQEPSYKRLMDFIREKTDCMCMWDISSDESYFANAHPLDMDFQRTALADGRMERRIIKLGGREFTAADRFIDGIHTTWAVEHFCKSTEDVDAFMHLPYVPASFDAGDYARIEKEVGERGIIMSSLSDPAYIAMKMMDFADALVWAMTETEHFSKTLNIIHERSMENLRRSLDAATVHLYRICGPEYLTPPYLPRGHFERFVVPYVRDMVDLIHARGAKARLHCHGRIGSVLDLIAATGADAIDPCEAPPDGDIELFEVKRRVGDKMTIFGNLQLKLLENGSADEVREAVIKAMEAGKPGGRFGIMPTAAPINVPLTPRTEENYRIFIETALESGFY